MGITRSGFRISPLLSRLCFALIASSATVAVGFTQISARIFDLSAINDNSIATFTVTFDEGIWDPQEQTLTWSLPEGVELYDDVSGEWVASLLNATLFVRMAGAGAIEMNVGLLSGPSNTTVIIGSPLVTFSETIPANFAQARASASFTLTDAEGDGALLVGYGTPGSGAFRSYYNGYLSGGTRFTHLVGLISVDQGGTATASQADPAVGYREIGEAVSDFSTEIAFTVSPIDLAFATTASGMPEPESCLGDINGDGHVDVSDLGAILAAYGSQAGDPDFNPDADLDQNERVDISDLARLLSVYGTECY